MKLFEADSKEIIPQVVEWRRHLHQHPEVSFQEFKTTEYIIEQIEKLPAVTYKRIAKTGVVAYLEGAKPGPVIALRADIDALAMPEMTKEAFKSVNEGVMHACGHDSHTAMLLGALYVMSRNQASLAGKYVFIFQAAEELPPGGAIELVKAGVLDGVDAILGQHVMPNFDTGHIALKPGYMCANSDIFKLTVKGRGGHASLPHMVLDPIPVAAQIVTALQQLVSRQVNPLDSAVVSVTTFHSGTATNVIPDSVEMTGTVRTYKTETRDLMEKHLRQIVDYFARAFDMTVELEYNRGYHSLENDPVYTQAVVDMAEELYGKGTAVDMEPAMGGEDFSYYLDKVPGCFYFLGVGNEAKDCIYPTHNTKFQIDEEAFAMGVTLMVNGAVRFSQLVEAQAHS